MRVLIWAFIERLSPRVGTALLLLVFASTSGPVTVGYYAAAMTGYALLQAISDGAVKRVSLSAVSSVQGRAFLRRYRLAYSLLGSFYLLAVLCIIRLWGAPWIDILALVPILLIPWVMSIAVVPLARMQLAGNWPRISRASVVSTLIALSVGFPLTWIFRNAFGSVMQLLLTETIFAISMLRLARKYCPESVLSESDSNFKNAFWSSSVFTVTLHGQYQLDRVFIGVGAGPAGLGAYNLAWSLGRSITDSLASGTLNVLQAKILDGKSHSPAEMRLLVGVTLKRALLMVGGVVVATYFGARFLAPLILGDEWHEMLNLVPLISVSAVPAITAYCFLPVLMYMKRLKWAIAPRVFGLALALAVGWAAQFSLAAAVWIVLCREILSLTVMLIGAREVVTLKVVAQTLLAIVTLLGFLMLASLSFGPL